MNITTRREKRRFFGPLLLTVWLILGPASARAYVLMGEHVLDLMVQALGQADTLEATQSLTIYAAPSLPSTSTLQETVRIRFPYDFRADALGDGNQRQMVFSATTALVAVNGVLQDGPPPRYARYADILMAKPRQALTDHLRTMGVDVAVSSLGRLEDRYCYIVGARFPDENAPQLWVDKDSFLPIRLMLPPAARAPEDGPVEIRYRNWRIAEGTAYPMHVVMLQNHRVMEEIRVERFLVNPEFPSDLFDIWALRQEWSRPAEAVDDAAGARPEPPAPPLFE